MRRKSSSSAETSHIDLCTVEVYTVPNFEKRKWNGVKLDAMKILLACLAVVLFS